MDVKIKYVTGRRNRDGTLRYYWQRPGFPLSRLPTDLTKLVAAADRLNREAEGQVGAQGSTAWVVKTYRESDEFAGLARGTVKYYTRILKDIEGTHPHLPFSDAWTRRVVIDFVNTYSKGMRKQAGAVLRNLFNCAMYHGVAKENCARDLRIRSSGRRDQVFTSDDCVAWLDACGGDETMRMAFTVLRYTVQRPNDGLLMTWDRYNDNVISLRQQKTKKLVEVPCHYVLKEALEATKPKATSPFIVSNGDKGLSYTRFCERFRHIADRAGLQHLQARDLRRTAAVNMALAGATETEIAAIAGWSIQQTRGILETYLPRNVEMAKNAVSKWEEKSRKV